MESWAQAADVFAAHRTPTYAAIAQDIATAPEGSLPERPLAVLSALRRAALEGRATDPFTGDVAAIRADARRLSDEVAAAVDIGLVQYTDPCRIGDILPGILIAARWYPGRPIRLIDLGTSAGMILLMTSMGVRYPTGTWSPDDPVDTVASALSAPAELLTTPLLFDSAVGIDLRPLDLREPESETLVRSYMWPDATAREERLTQGIRAARERPPTLIQGDIPLVLADVAREHIDRDCLTIIIDSAFSHYLPVKDQNTVGRILDRLCGLGPLALVTGGTSVSGRPMTAALRVVDLTGRRRLVYAESDLISEEVHWLDPTLPGRA